MEKVPKDVWCEILLCLDVKDVLSVSLVAKRYNVMNNESFWRRKLVKDGYRDAFAEYIPSQKERYKLGFRDHILILREMESYFDQSLGKFRKYINVEEYRKNFVRAIYDLRENILSKKIFQDEYGNYSIPQDFYSFFPLCHYENFDDFEHFFIFESLIDPLLHREITHNESSDEDSSERELSRDVEYDSDDALNVVRIEPGFFREIGHGFILARYEEGLCAIKVDEGGIWRELREEEREICGTLDIPVRLPSEQDEESQKVLNLPDEDETCIQYMYFDDISITMNRHFVLYRNEVAFKVAEGPIWRPLTEQEKEFARTLGLQVL
jgi:hypothetical protein